MKRLRIGLVVNPVAGIGGRAALKGSDGDEIVNKALSQGLKCLSNERVAVTLVMLKPYADQIDWFSAPGSMGEACLLSEGYLPKVIGSLASSTSAEDTIRFCQQLVQEGIDLLLFAGGDGTARNVFDAIGANVLALGVPAGVKMHSGVYAISPQAAARVLEQFLQAKPVSVSQQEVRDIDEEQLRAGRINAKYYGELLVPNDNRYIQQVKNSGEIDETGMQAEIAAGIADDIDEAALYIIGAGTTPQALMDELGLPNTLLGLDVILGRELIAADVTEQDLLTLLKAHPYHSTHIVMTATGMQGHVIGRGNQQLSPEVLTLVGKDNLLILISPKKLSAFAGRPLLMDSGSPELDLQWSGWVKIITGYRETAMYPLSCGLD
ncbi:MAG: ATP-NAD kinase family protein [Cellvibrionaceae bacterium]